MVRTRAVKARASDDSNIITAQIYPPPAAPRDVNVAVTESGNCVELGGIDAADRARRQAAIVSTAPKWNRRRSLRRRTFRKRS